jgi:hypothetical protein
MIIKIALVASLLTAAVLAYRNPLNSRNAALRRLFAVALLAAGAVAVFFPALVTAFAARVGVGRGTDLLVYFLAVVSLLAFLSLWRRIYELEQRLVLLTRGTALHDAQHRLHPASSDQTRPEDDEN